MMDDFTYRVLAKSWPHIFMASPVGPPHSEQSAAPIAKPVATTAIPVASQCEDLAAIELTKSDIERIDQIVKDTIREAAEFEERRAKNDAAAVAKVVEAVLANQGNPIDPEPEPQFTPRPTCRDWLGSQLPPDDGKAESDFPPLCHGQHPFGVGSDKFLTT